MCKKAKSLGSKITSVPVESAELLENYRSKRYEEKETTSSPEVGRKDLYMAAAGG